MTTMNKIQLNLTIPERYRNLLRRMAAERMMSDPGQIISGTAIATEILLNALKDVAGENINEGGKRT